MTTLDGNFEDHPKPDKDDSAWYKSLGVKKPRAKPQRATT